VNIKRAVPNIKSELPAETRDFFVDLLGFDDAEMDRLLAVTLDSDEAEDEVPEPPAPAPGGRPLGVKAALRRQRRVLLHAEARYGPELDRQ
jgi:hypothetical protein